jgi:hypothetical protein
MKKTYASRSEKGQSAPVFAVVATALVLFIVGVMDYMITTARAMEAVGIADLSAHAGVQELNVLPNGVIEVSPSGPGAAASMYSRQDKSYTQLANVYCGRINARPACEVAVRVQSAGFLIPQHWITVRAVGYMEYGSTRGGQ